MTDLSGTPAPASAPGARRLKVALIASLALNLLFVGAIAGTMFVWKKPHRGPQPRGEDFGLMSITRDLPPERRKELRKQLRAERDQLRPSLDEIRNLRRAAADALAAEPFDRAALERAITAVGEKDRTLRETAVQSFLGHAERLTAEERKLLAERWRKRTEFRHKNRMKGAEEKDAKAAPPAPPAEAAVSP